MSGGIEAALLFALQAILSGILVGGVYGILSVGLSFAFGVMRIVNFAHGELVMYGMYAGVIASKNFGIDPLLILPISFLVLAGIGALLYLVVFRRFVGHATLQQLLAAIGCALVLQMIIQIIFGPMREPQTPCSLAQYLAVRAVLPVASADRCVRDRGCGGGAVELLLRVTTWGKAVRAVADDQPASELVGINSQYINIGAFALASGLAGIAGTVLVTYFPTSPAVGFAILPIIIIATTIGGLGSIGGTFLGGICCGVIQQTTAMLWNSALQDVPLYLLLLLFIAYKPTGFFGLRSE